MAQQFSVHAAKTHLSQLIEAALAGDDIVIAKDGKPVVRLVAISPTKFNVGLLKGKLGPGPDFFEPLDDAELKDWEPNEL
jgi:prevent-host-death family protein